MTNLIALCAAAFVFSTIFYLGNVFKRKEILVEKRLRAAKELVIYAGNREEEKQSSLLSHIYVPAFVRENLQEAGSGIKPEEFVCIWLLCALGPGMVSFVRGDAWLLSALLVFAGSLLPPFYLKSVKAKQISKFQTQLGDALMIIANSLKVGHSFEQSVELVAKEMPEPLGAEFGRMSREIRNGEDMEQAMKAMAVRMRSRELDLLISAVMIQKQVGGNLSNILYGISGTIQNRIKLRRNVKTLTAQGKMSAIVIGGLPIAILLFLSFFMPGYVEPLYGTFIGQCALGVCIVLESLGFFIMFRLSSPKI